MSLVGPTSVTQSPSRAATPRAGTAWPRRIFQASSEASWTRGKGKGPAPAGPRGARRAAPPASMASKRSSATASEAEKTPIRVRRRVSRWAPQPSFSPSSLAIERMYVPEVQEIEKARRPSCERAEARARETRTFLGSDGTLSPLARHLVELPAADLLGGIGRRRLQELAAERVGGRLDRLARHRRSVAVGPDGLALAVVGRVARPRRIVPS